MSEYLVMSDALTHTADRIRAKTGGTDPIPWDVAKGFGDAVDAIQPDDSKGTVMLTITPSENSQSIEIPFSHVFGKFFIVAWCPDITGEGDVPRIKQFAGSKLPLNNTYSGRIDVVNADGAEDYWSQTNVAMSGETIKLSTSRSCYFAAGETYTVQVTEVTV